MKKLTSYWLYKRARLFAVLFMVFGVLAVVSPQDTFAATKTWTGGGSDRNWSTAGNWSPSGAPIDDDDIIIGSDADTSATVNDIVGLSVNSITFNADGPTAIDTTAQTLTIAGPVTRGTSDQILAIFGPIVLDANSIWTGVDLGPVSPTSSYSLDLNSNVLIFEEPSLFIGLITQPITGAGSVVYSMAEGDQGFQILAASDYTGDTFLNRPGLGNGTPVMALDPAAFGTSAIALTGRSILNLNFFASGSDASTFTNTITIDGNETRLMLGCEGTCEAGTEIALPNIDLQGSLVISVNVLDDEDAIVDLAGITANGNCAIYNDGTFVNGPAVCSGGGLGSNPSPNAPGTPETGVNLSTGTGILAVLGLMAGTVGTVLVHRRAIN